MTAALDAARPAADDRPYALTLFVSGASGLSARAIDDVRLLCDVHLTAQVRLAVVDIHVDPAAAIRRGVSVAPTLVRTRPLPVRRIVGDLSQTERVLAMLMLPVDGDLGDGVKA
jgi:circadian clock protein KaiB